MDPFNHLHFLHSSFSASAALNPLVPRGPSGRRWRSAQRTNAAQALLKHLASRTLPHKGRPKICGLQSVRLVSYKTFNSVHRTEGGNIYSLRFWSLWIQLMRFHLQDGLEFWEKQPQNQLLFLCYVLFKQHGGVFVLVMNSSW